MNGFWSTTCSELRTLSTRTREGWSSDGNSLDHRDSVLVKLGLNELQGAFGRRLFVEQKPTDARSLNRERFFQQLEARALREFFWKLCPSRNLMSSERWRSLSGSTERAGRPCCLTLAQRGAALDLGGRGKRQLVRKHRLCHCGRSPPLACATLPKLGNR